MVEQALQNIKRKFNKVFPENKIMQLVYTETRLVTKLDII